MFSLHLKLQRVLARLGPKLATTNKRVGKGKPGFTAGEADRTMTSFHMYLLPLLYTQFPSVAFEERQNECFSAWKILRRDPKHVYKGQIKSNPLKADRPSMEVPCYPRVWSLLHALSSKRSENQVASSCTAHNLCLAEVLNWDGCCYLCKVKWHCPD